MVAREPRGDASHRRLLWHLVQLCNAGSVIGHGRLVEGLWGSTALLTDVLFEEDGHSTWVEVFETSNVVDLGVDDYPLYTTVLSSYNVAASSGNVPNHLVCYAIGKGV